MSVLLSSVNGFFCELLEFDLHTQERAIGDTCTLNESASASNPETETVTATVTFPPGWRGKSRALSLRYGRSEGMCRVNACCDVSSFTPAPNRNEKDHWESEMKRKDKKSQAFVGNPVKYAIRDPRASTAASSDPKDLGSVELSIYRNKLRGPQDMWVQFVIKYRLQDVESQYRHVKIIDPPAAPSVQRRYVAVGSRSQTNTAKSSVSFKIRLKKIQEPFVGTLNSSPLLDSLETSEKPSSDFNAKYNVDVTDNVPTGNQDVNMVHVLESKRHQGSSAVSVHRTASLVSTNMMLSSSSHLPRLFSHDSNVVLQWGRLDSDKESESGSASDDSASSEDEKSTVKAALHDIKWLEKSLEKLIREKRSLKKEITRLQTGSEGWDYQYDNEIASYPEVEK